MLMGIALIFNFPISLYIGGLNGLQRQVLTNGILVSSTFVRSVGAVVVLLYYSATVQAFFVWNIIAYFFQTFLLAFSLWRALPRTANRATFQKTLLLATRHFTAGIALVSILGVVLSQLGNVVLPKLVPLSAFGYYTLAAMLAASGAGFIGGPLYAAFFPRITQLVARNDVTELKSFYHLSCGTCQC